MRFETIKSNKKILLSLVVVLVMGITVIITTSLAKYKLSESIKIAEGTINYSPSDFSLMGIYIESDDGYVTTDTVPESGFVLNETESYCKIGDNIQDVTISYDVNTKTLNVAPMTTKGMKCFLYFDEIKGITVENIIASSTISTRTNFSAVYTAENTKTLFTAEDDDGTSYYFAGAPTDNWVKFAGFYWRIIRINGDGSIRMIYQGTSANTTGDGTRISKIAFNSSSGNNAYVGYMYTTGEVHGLGTSSPMKNELESWYTTNLMDFTDNIDKNAGFCGDREPSTSTSSINGNGGTGITNTYYGAYIRLYTNKSPSLKCADSSDLYTINNSIKGNKALTNPIGLITMDEIFYAGGFYSTDNTNFYLYTAQDYYTISPFYNKGLLNASLFYLTSVGDLDGSSSTNSKGVRPVINLRSDTLFKPGTTGTSTNPYEVVE